MLFSRFAIGVVVLIPILHWRKQSQYQLTKQLVFRIALSGSFAFALIAFTYHAIESLDVGIVMILLYCFPVEVALVLQFRGKQNLSRKHWSFIILTLVGLFVLLASKGQNLSLYGLAISIVGLFCFIAFILTASEISYEVGAVTFNFFVSLLGLLILLGAYFLPFGIDISPSRGLVGHLSILGNGVFYIVSWVIFFESSRIIGATRTALLSCSEPLFAAILAIPLLGQNLSTLEWLGFFIVLSSLLMFEKSSVPRN